ncbi:MAG: Mur ligase family protein [Patescibacteria group bacterium]
MPKIALAGFGMEGKAAYEWLKGKAEMEIFDEQVIADAPVPAHVGLTIPGEFAVVYKTPGISDSKLKLESPATRVTTLMDDVVAKVGARAVGITGTKGKSTVASLVHHILQKSGKKSILFGNIGIADMELVRGATPDTIFVLELSSYQCEHLSHSPHVGVLTNLYPEHLSHHGSFEAYKAAKMNLFAHQALGDVFIDGRTIAAVEPFETKLLGAHNQTNCTIAVAAVAAFGVAEAEAREAVQSFEPLPYRNEKVGEYRGVTFYDDALATIPEATLASIAALPQVDTIILGGEDRGISFDGIANALPLTRINTFIVFPDTGPKMVAKVAVDKVVHASSMEEAVRAAYEHTPEGGAVLLSPASPSFNMFKDYKDRSAQYREWIKKLA